MKDTKIWIVKAGVDNILATWGETCSSDLFGPLGYQPMIYKTKAGAERKAKGFMNGRAAMLNVDGTEAAQ